MSFIIKPVSLNEVSGFESIVSFPKNIYLSDQNKEEVVLLLIRRHKITLFFNLLVNLLLLSFPFIIEFVLNSLNQNLFNSFLNLDIFFKSKWWSIVILCWIALILSYIFDTFYRWFYNINILTNEKFIDIDLESIFSSRVEVASLFDIQDAKDSQKGIIQSIFNMGDLVLLTASGATIFSLDNIPKAHIIRDFITDIIVKVKKLQMKENS